MRMTRSEFITASTAFAVSPMLSAEGRAVKTPLMLDTKRMAIWNPHYVLCEGLSA